MKPSFDRGFGRRSHDSTVSPTLSSVGEAPPSDGTGPWAPLPDRASAMAPGSALDSDRDPRGEASPPGPTARPAAIEQQIEDTTRMRNAFRAGIVVWSFFFLVDLLVVTRLGVGTIRFFAATRLIFCAALTVTLWILRRPARSLRVRTALDLAMHAGCVGAIALMCVRFWGLESPYPGGICLVLGHRMIFTGESWKRGAILNGISAAMYPLVMVGAALFSPAIARQFHETRALVLFGISLSFVFGIAGLGTTSGHMVWALRRAVIEARSLGGYRLKRAIGRGATGEVWLAHHAALKRDVAVKILHREMCTDVAISRFEREARATAELAHPNTVRVFDFGTTHGGLWYYAMELLEGETLADLVRREGPLSPDRATHLALQASRALGEAHAHGIVHRDVKPSNLFVTTMGGEPDFVKVLDFGVARFFDRSDRPESTLTIKGDIVGTPAYMSPEAVLGHEVDARADIYAMGAVLYFMLAGRPPFGACEGAVGTMLAHVHELPKPPSVNLGAAIPAAIEAVTMRCLEKKPSDWYADATALVAALATLPMAQVSPPAISAGRSSLPGRAEH